MVFPFVFATGAGRGNGRGKGRQPAAGIAWDRDGENAQTILRGYLANDPNYLTWNKFKSTAGSTWIISAANPNGSYTLDNLCRNYKKTIKRYHQHIDPNDPFDGQFDRRQMRRVSSCCSSALTLSSLLSSFASGEYPDGFLEAVGAPGLPVDNPGGLDFEPGFDPEALGPDASGSRSHDPDADPDDDD